MKASAISLLKKCRRETGSLHSNIFPRPSSSNLPPPGARLNDYCCGGHTQFKGLVFTRGLDFTQGDCCRSLRYGSVILGCTDILQLLSSEISWWQITPPCYGLQPCERQRRTGLFFVVLLAFILKDIS